MQFSVRTVRTTNRLPVVNAVASASLERPMISLYLKGVRGASSRGRIQNVIKTAATLKVTRYTWSRPNSSTLMVPAADAEMANTPKGVRLTNWFVIFMSISDAVERACKRESFSLMPISATPLKMQKRTTAGTTFSARD